MWNEEKIPLHKYEIPNARTIDRELFMLCEMCSIHIRSYDNEAVLVAWEISQDWPYGDRVPIFKRHGQGRGENFTFCLHF